MRKLFVIFMFLFLIGSVFAMSQPEGFNGNIIIKGGGNVEGKTLAGFLNGNIAGSAIIHNNQFDIVITDESGKGGNILFYIGDKKAKETFNFETFSVINTNLTFTISSDNKEIEFCGDNICNNGETCSTCSGDCGACTTSNENSGGSGGGGGSSNYVSSSNSTNNPSEEGNENELSKLSIINLNEKEKQKNSGITGNSIADFAKSGAGIGLVVILAIVLIIGVITFRKKFKPKKWKKYR